jgi:TonB family protein
MIRLTVGIFLVFFLALTQAQVPVSFERTMAAFEAGDLERARIAFARMSRAGFTEAQFNYGAMLMNGDGGERDVVEGIAWIQVAANDDYEPAIGAVEMLREQLGEERWGEITQTADDLTDQYGRQNLLERHQPRLGEEAKTEEVRTGGMTVQRTLGGFPLSIDMQPPRYPREAAASQAMGIVRLGVWIEPDGQARHAHVIEAYPQGLFDRAALRSMERIRAEWLEQPPEQAQYYVRQITFGMRNLPPGALTETGGAAMRELRRLIDESGDDLATQHRMLVMVEEMALPAGVPLDPEILFGITHQAAIAGIADAQLDLGRQLQTGRVVQQDRESARFWLEQAAFEGHAVASFELSRFPEIDPDFQRDLRQAAIDDQLLGAVLWEIRYLVEHPEQADAARMQSLLEQLPNRLQRDRSDPILSQARQIATG